MSEELRRDFNEKGIRKVKVGGFDVDGLLRGKYISLEKFWSALDKGFGFCDVIFGWDICDQLYDNATVTGWETGYPDALARIDASTFRVLPDAPDTANFLVDFYTPDGKPHPACPRNLLKKVIKKASDAGFTAKFSAEFEFWVFQETPDSMHRKDFDDLDPLSPGMFGYSWLRAGQHQALVDDILDTCAEYDIEIEGIHTETGPGVWEAALRYDDVLAAADKAALFKTTLKQICARHDLSVTFMAKWNADLPGSSGHIHQSLWDAGEQINLFAAAGSDRLSEIGASLLRWSGQPRSGAHRPLFTLRQQLQALRPRRLGSVECILGNRKSNLRFARHPRPDGSRDADRVPADRRGHQPVHRDGGMPRRRPVRDRREDRATGHDEGATRRATATRRSPFPSRSKPPSNAFEAAKSHGSRSATISSITSSVPATGSAASTARP